MNLIADLIWWVASLPTAGRLEQDGLQCLFQLNLFYIVACGNTDSSITFEFIWLIWEIIV